MTLEVANRLLLEKIILPEKLSNEVNNNVYLRFSTNDCFILIKNKPFKIFFRTASLHEIIKIIPNRQGFS